MKICIFKCRENSFDTMNNIYSATRSVADLKEYISSNFLSCVDWTNNFIYFKDFLCVCFTCFTCRYVCASCACLVPEESLETPRTGVTNL